MRAIIIILSILTLFQIACSVNGFISWKTGEKYLIDNRPINWPQDNDADIYQEYPQKWIEVKYLNFCPNHGWKNPLKKIGLKELNWIRHTINLKPYLTSQSIDDEYIPPNCSDLLDNRFLYNGGSIGFSIGRAPEECSEAPYMIWYRKDNSIEGSTRIIPFYNMNVESIWYLNDIIIFGLEATYELGGWDDKIVIWDLSSNKWISFQIPENNIGTIMEGWLNAEANWENDTLILRSTGKHLSLRPLKAEWQLW